MTKVILRLNDIPKDRLKKLSPPKRPCPVLHAFHMHEEQSTLVEAWKVSFM